MKLQSFSIRVNADDARAMALKQIGPLGKLAVGKNPDIHMRTIFIENKIITYRFEREPSVLAKLLRRKEAGRQSKIQVIVNTSTKGTSYYDGQGAEIVEMEVAEEQVQYSDYPDSQLISRGNILARRILHRRLGGNLTLTPVEVVSVFRPYHVAFFGELKEGTKVRYAPVAADGCTVKRTF